MNLFKVFLILVISTFSSACGSGIDSSHTEPASVSYISAIGGKELQFRLPQPTSDSYPDWTPEKRLLINIMDIIPTARNELLQYIKKQDLGEWNLSSVELARYPKTDKWFFIVGFEKKDNMRVKGRLMNDVHIPIMLTGRPVNGEWGGSVK